MNGKAFFAILARDAHVARRNLIPLLFQTFLAAAAVRFYFRPRDGGQRLSSGGLQEPSASRDHGHQHGVHRNLGRGHAADRGIPVHAGN